MDQNRSVLASTARMAVPRRRRADRACTVHLETLETRELLSGTTVFSSPGAIAAPRKADTIVLPLTTDRLVPGRSGKSLLQIEVLPTSGGRFRARQFPVINPRGRRVRARLTRGPHGALIETVLVKPGDYSIKVRGRGRTTGSFVALVTVPSPTRRIVRQGINATSNTINFQIINGTGNANGQSPAIASSQIYLNLYGKDAADASAQNPDGWVSINASGQVVPLTPSVTQVPSITLDQVPNGIPVLNSESITSGQIYIGVGKAVVSPVNTGVATINLTNGGSGYTSAPAVSFSGGGGTGAQGTATIEGGVVTGVTINQTGTGYTSAPTVTFSGGGGAGAAGTANIQILGVAAPSPSNPSDPNASTYWDFAEFTLSSENINADLSQVDEVGFPITLQLSPNDPAFADGAGVYPSRSSLISDFQNFLTAQLPGANASEFGPLVTDLPSVQQGTYRILAPSNYVLANPTSSLATYYNSYIQQFFSAGNPNLPTITVAGGQQPVTPATAAASVVGGAVTGVGITSPGAGYIFPPDVTLVGGGGTGATARAVLNYAGQVSGITVTNPGSGYGSAPTVQLTMDPSWTFNSQIVQLPNTSNPSAPYTALQLTGQNGAQQGLVYDVYSPFTPGPVTPAAANGATWMVFACAGVFADNVQQFPSDGGASTMLGNLENQIVSAMNRGVALDPYQDWSNASMFYPVSGTANWYSAFLHQSSITIDAHAYGFAYDDQGGNSTDMSVNDPQAMIVTIGWDAPLFPVTNNIKPKRGGRRPGR